MKILFEAKTNKDYCMINTAVFTMPNGLKLVLDRDRTLYSAENGELSMEWKNCYLWAVNEQHLFSGQCAYLGSDAAEYLNTAVGCELEIEDDADPDYYVKDVEFKCY